MSDRPRISACLIVRDEAALLPGCLRLLRGRVDEIVVVDTGSEDETVEIARASGAAVHAIEWPGDFAAARNEALARATGDWCFTIDADERLCPGPPLPDVCGQAPASVGALIVDQYNVTQRPGAPWPDVYVTGVARLFRLRRGVRYEGRVHERITESVREAGLTVGFAEVWIEHRVAEVPNAYIQQKQARYLAMMEAMEDDATGWLPFQMAKAAKVLGDAPRALALFESVGRDAPTAPRRALAWAYASLVAGDEGNGKRADALASRAMDEHPNLSASRFAQARAHHRARRRWRARRLFQTVRQPGEAQRVPIEGDIYLMPHQIERWRGRSYMSAGRPRAALSAFSNGLRLYDGDTGCAHGCEEAHRAMQHEGEARAWTERAEALATQPFHPGLRRSQQGGHSFPLGSSASAPRRAERERPS